MSWKFQLWVLLLMGHIPIIAKRNRSLEVIAERGPCVMIIADVCIKLNLTNFPELISICHVVESRATEIIQGRPWDGINELSRIRGLGADRIQDIREQGLIL
jgi:hypothetical protein